MRRAFAERIAQIEKVIVLDQLTSDDLRLWGETARIVRIGEAPGANEVCPHSSLENRSPNEYARLKQVG